MNPVPFRIKICGVTAVDDAQAVVRAGADAIGLNFYAGSSRYVTTAQAASIVAVVPRSVAKVGVFVNPTVEEVRAVLKQVPLDVLQFHGDEPPKFLEMLRDIAIVRAFRWTSKGGPPIDKYLARSAVLGCRPAAVLIDADVAGQYGGTGATADWEGIARWRHSSREPMPAMVLAGGLNLTNVAAAIAAVKPDAVDTASGVESSPGRKDARLVTAFVEAAKRALADLQ